MKTLTTKLDWPRDFGRWKKIVERVRLRAERDYRARWLYSQQLLRQAAVGDLICAHNWGTALPGERGMLCRRAITLVEDRSASHRADRIVALAWNRYCVPHGCPASDVPSWKRAA